MGLVSENPSQGLLKVLTLLVEKVEEGMKLREEKKEEWSEEYKANFHHSLNPEGKQRGPTD